MGHEWHFGNSAKGENVYITAVCSKCGLIRRAAGVDGKRIDLRGDCLGEPQEPEETTPQVF